MNIKEQICKQIRQHGDMVFADYMQHALYNPAYGYYSSGLQKFGPQGDFITAPELTPLFGQALGNQCQQVMQELNSPVILEFGAGSGQLAIDILQHLERLQCLPLEYWILEVSGSLRRRQQEYIKQALPHLYPRVQWLSTWPTAAFEGVVIANEVLDAMPVYRFMQTENGLLESYISLNPQGELVVIYKPSHNNLLIHYVRGVLPSTFIPYQSEANLFLESWLQECYAMLTKGAFFIIDYGFPRHEYYHPERSSGTLMCHYRHQAHPNPLANPGEEDITAHVDFTQVAEAGFAAGFHVAGYTNQAAFLLGNDLLMLLDTIQDERERFKAQQAVKQLVQATEMGELFKVLSLTKELELDLNGFKLLDKRASL